MSDQTIALFQKFCCMYPDCGKEYTLKFNLKRHVQVYHLRAKQVECEICHKVFRIHQNYVEHKFIHMNQKPYSCRICHESFRHNSTFLKHKREKLCKRFQRRSFVEDSESEYVGDEI